MKLSDLFEEEPEQWGLRGDPFLWRELRERLRGVAAPETPGELQALIEKEIELALGHPVACGEIVVIDRFKHGGMSSGGICLEFWRSKGIPLLVSRHRRP